MIKVSIVVFVSTLLIHIVFSADKPCGQHDFKITTMRLCKGATNNGLQINNLTFVVTDDCRVVPRGCYTVKKKLPDIKVNYHVSKPPLFNKNGTEDMCKSMADPKFQKSVAAYKNQVDAKCPIEAGQYCITKGSTVIDKLNPSLLNMAVGTIKARIEMESVKAKAKSCVEAEAVISKKG
ncbi:UNVERIFIED_CONTAM: hypothetical protein PYX00_004386 [Menopon gallinae]|uniref:Uncharacterized protein n=1 Tax=Menopon gallinae TaxID=328185 RepID=A0AAW2I519_9NEOP